MMIDGYAAATFWVIALLASALYGYYAIDIFKSHSASKEQAVAWRWHQRWSYFLGSLVGWLALWLLLRKFGGCAFAECTANVEVVDVIGAFVAFVGVTGYLKDAVVGVVAGLGSLAGKLTEGLSAWVERR